MQQHGHHLTHEVVLEDGKNISIDLQQKKHNTVKLVL